MSTVYMYTFIQSYNYVWFGIRLLIQEKECKKKGRRSFERTIKEKKETKPSELKR